MADRSVPIPIRETYTYRYAQAMALWPLPCGLLVSAVADGADAHAVHLLAHPLDELKRVSFANGGTIPVWSDAF